jgi:hypothetical protein
LLELAPQVFRIVRQFTQLVLELARVRVAARERPRISSG